MKQFDEYYCKGRKFNLTNQRFVYRDTSHSNIFRFIFYVPDLKQFVSLKVHRKVEFYKSEHKTMADVYLIGKLKKEDNSITNLAYLKEKSNLKFYCHKEPYPKFELLRKYEEVKNSHWSNLEGRDSFNWHISYEDLYKLEEV